MILLRENSKTGRVVFEVRLKPGGRRDAITGLHQGALKIEVRAPALEERANRALIEFLAKFLKIPKRSVEILVGEHRRQKTVAVAGVSLQALQKMFSDL